MTELRARVHDPARHLRLRAGNSLSRRVNGWLNTLQSRYFRNSRVVGYPKHLIVDPTNFCNLRCPICPSGQRKLGRARGFIDIDLFRSLIREVGPYLYTLTLTNWGEPLLHPQLADMISYAKSFGIYVGFSTNLQILRPGQEGALIGSGVDAIAISIDGPDQQTYESYRVGGQLAKVIRNTQRLIAARDARQLASPILRWQCLITAHNEAKLADLRRLAEDNRVDEMLFVPIYLDIGGMFLRSPYQRLAMDRGWLPGSGNFALNDLATGRLNDAPRHCALLWESAVVNWDGGIAPCCALIDHRHDYGSLTRARFRSIWNNRIYREARKHFSRWRKPNRKLPCTICKAHGIPIR